MDIELRKSGYIKLLKEAGKLTDFISGSLEQKKKLTFTNIGSPVPGCHILIPLEPIKNDGSVDVVINFRGLTADPKTIGSLGINSVIATCEGVGPQKDNMGSKLLDQQFGNASVVNKIVASIIGNLKQKFPDKNVHLGKLSIVGFSGGGSPIGSLLMQRDKLPKELSNVVISDGAHFDNNSPKMQALLNYANESKNDPSKRLTLISTMIDPGHYIATRQVANNLVQQLNLQKQNPEKWNGNLKPTAEAKSGGVHIIDLYNHPDPYQKIDPTDGKLKANIIGTAGQQHINALKYLKDNYADFVNGIIN